jgi:hypothetical protein
LEINILFLLRSLPLFGRHPSFLTKVATMIQHPFSCQMECHRLFKHALIVGRISPTWLRKNSVSPPKNRLIERTKNTEFSSQ